ncbi:hypothetical protein [Cryobacterium sp. GrIS_2_6]|uniref:hypothetical protein n=1 Tax=Cryobacterium sp. GrIS_2_6 TaxID=3162785 RepID=UPI002E00E369|nr:hypothetical protein [Cryobacterium psychrotolerans]
MPTRDTDTEIGAEVFSPRYDLSDAELEDLTVRLLASRTRDLPEHYRLVAIEVDGRSPFSNVGRHVERVVFEATFGNDAAQMTDEYGAYEGTSTFFISIDRDTCTPSGVLRIIEDSPHGLKSLNDAAQEPFNLELDEAFRFHAITDPTEIWDIGTVAVLPDYRRGEAAVSVQLYRAMYLSALVHRIKHIVSIVDDRPLRKMRDFLGIPFVPLADTHPGPYLGSKKSHAVYGYVPHFLPKARAHRDTMRGLLVRNALQRLVDGTEDDSISLDVQPDA